MAPAEESSFSGSTGSKAVEDNRRGLFVKLAAIVLGTIAYAAPVAAGLVAFLNPLRMKAGGGDFIRLAALDALPADGAPQRVPVVLDRTDAWNHFPNEPVGAVYLRRAGSDLVEAIQVVCPHAGCFVNFDAANQQFICPCHNGHFDLAGKRLDVTSPSPRDLDGLEVEIRNDGEIWVKYETFLTGTTEKVVEA